MVFAVKPAVRIFPDPDALSRAAAKSVFELVSQAARERKQIFLALAGGNTPRRLYQCLGAEYGSQIPWEQVHLFWSDERYLPLDDAQSNYRMAREALLEFISIPDENLHPVPTDLPTPEQAAISYERLLRSFFPADWPRFDLVLLGLGADGHTASLFPNSAALEENERWVISTEAPLSPKQRITLSLPVLNHAARIYFLVSGGEKAQTLSRVVTTSCPEGLPASRVRPHDGKVTWWVDSDAASLLGPRAA